MKAGISTFNKIYRDYKDRARKKGLDWGITKERAMEMFTDNCFYCGSPPTRIRDIPDRKGTFTYNGIDRRDSGLGYVSDNCVACCWECNDMKDVMGYADFIEHVFKICFHTGVSNIPNNLDVAGVPIEQTIKGLTSS